MYKALILSLLFAMLAVPGSAETWTKEDEEAYRKSKNLTLFAIQSFVIMYLTKYIITHLWKRRVEQGEENV